MNDSFRLALVKHQQGFLDQAAQLYLKVLGRGPEHADALPLLGVVTHQQGRHAQAIGVIRQAPALEPGVAMDHANPAEAYRAMAEYELASASAKEHAGNEVPISARYVRSRAVIALGGQGADAPRSPRSCER